jgi:tetratricopeptide (TPR) repeat protein
MGRCLLAVGFSFCVLLTMDSAPGFAQLKGATSLAGTVFTAGGDRRVDNATVTLCDDQGSRLEETSTDDAGQFSFSAIRPARYLLRVRAEGYETTELHVDLSLSAQRGLSVALKPLPRQDPPPERSSISAHELSMPVAARELMSSGMTKLFKEKDPQAALTDFQSATAKAPGFYEAYFESGLASVALHKELDAETQFRKSIEVSQQKYPDAMIALATLLLRREQGGEGEVLLRQGLAINPQSWQGQIELGKLELARGHLDAALTAAEKAESLAPLQPMVYRLLTATHLQQKNYSAAMTDLDNYIRLDPDSSAGVRAKELRAQVAQQLRAATAVATK